MVALSILGGITGITLLASFISQSTDEDNDSYMPLVKPTPTGQPRRSVTTPEKAVVVESVKQNVSTETPVLAKETVTLPVADMKTAPTGSEVRVLPPPVADQFPLRKGSKGHRVGRLQVFLLRNYGHKGEVLTDVFDHALEVRLQQTMGRTMVDEKTYKRYRMGKPVHEQVIIW